MVDRVTALELLEIQAEGSLDGRGRIAGVYGVTIACGQAQGQQASGVLWIGAEVPEPLAAELEAAFDRAPRSSSPDEPPPALEVCGRILEGGERALRRTAGPSFLFVDVEDTPCVSSARIERSDRADRTNASSWEALRGGNPGNWHPVEWDELLEGRLGPWAIATEGEIVVSICHTPGPVTARKAECGVWTHPAFRGRGHAAAVTAAWAEIMRPSGRYLFYSTDAENLSSQRVARRLRLEPVGWTWRLALAREDRDQVHPLSVLRCEGARS